MKRLRRLLRGSVNFPAKFFAGVAVCVIKLYKVSFAWKIPSCRYLPTCSDYAMQAIKEKGLIAGGYSAVKRICRCHPWGGSGHDPVI